MYIRRRSALAGYAGYSSCFAPAIQGTGSPPPGYTEVGGGGFGPYSCFFPPPTPAAAAAPTSITVNPNIVTNVSPQVSPTFQQSSGSGSQSAGTQQGSNVAAPPAPVYSGPIGVLPSVGQQAASSSPSLSDLFAALKASGQQPSVSPQSVSVSTGPAGGAGSGQSPEIVSGPAPVGTAVTTAAPGSGLLPAGISPNMLMWGAAAVLGVLLLSARNSKGQPA